MVQVQWGRRLAPILLGAGMLGTVVAAGLAPSIGAVAAQTNCQYSVCSSGSSTPFPWWILAVVVAVVVIVALLVLMLRRRPPSAAPAPEPWQPPEGASAPSGPSPPSAPPVMAGDAAGAAAPVANYVETPDDVGQSMPAVGAGAGAGAAAAGEPEPDIDSLMAELDKISGEILKKAPKKGTGGSDAAEGAEEADR